MNSLPKITVIALIAASSSVLFCAIYNPFIIINEGHVGIYYFFGSLSSSLLWPGMNFSPFAAFGRLHQVQYTRQYDSVTNVTCESKDGVRAVFERITVVNQLPSDTVYRVVKDFGPEYDKPLIYQRVSAIISQYCSNYTFVYLNDHFSEADDYTAGKLQEHVHQFANGLVIFEVQMTRPILPPAAIAAAESYSQTLAEKKRLGIENDIAAEKARSDALITETKQKEITSVLRAELERKELKAESDFKIAEINNRGKRLEHEELERHLADPNVFTIELARQYVQSKAGSTNFFSHNDPMGPVVAMMMRTFGAANTVDTCTTVDTTVSGNE